MIIKGIGVGDARSYRLPLPLLKQLGCNSIRTWGTDQLDDGLLRECESLGMSVFAGLWIDRLNGDSLQTENVAKECLRQIAPWQGRYACIRGCIVGNEVETRSGSIPPEAFWGHIASICGTVKKSLPSGVAVTTAVAEIGEARESKAALIQKHLVGTGLIDFLLINSYGGAASLPLRLQEQGFTGRWALGEYGVLGQWETPKEDLSFHSISSGGGSLSQCRLSMSHEQSSTEKAAFALSSYSSLATASPAFMGGFAFFGSYKHEVSDTWYSFSLPPVAPASLPLIVGDRLLAQAVIWNDIPQAGGVSSYDSALQTISSLCDSLGIPKAFGIEVDGHAARCLHWKMRHGATFNARPAFYPMIPHATAPASGGSTLSSIVGAIGSAVEGRALPSLFGGHHPQGHVAAPPFPVKTSWRLVRIEGASGEHEHIIGTCESLPSSAAGEVSITLPPSTAKGEVALYRLYCFVSSALPATAATAHGVASGGSGAIPSNALSRLGSATEGLRSSSPRVVVASATALNMAG
jgi:hypothetical protein